MSAFETYTTEDTCSTCEYFKSVYSGNVNVSKLGRNKSNCYNYKVEHYACKQQTVISNG